MVPPIRRVVTGQTAEGKNVFTHVEEVKSLDLGAGAEWYGVWGWDSLPELPHFDDSPYRPRSVFPRAVGDGGLRVNVVTFPAGYGVTEADHEATAAPPEEYSRLLAAESPGGDHDPKTGMHSTDSVDLGLVFSGELVAVQEDREVVLRPGDVYVQNGALHAWRNPSAEPCVICFVAIGATRRQE